MNEEKYDEILKILSVAYYKTLEIAAINDKYSKHFKKVFDKYKKDNGNYKYKNNIDKLVQKYHLSSKTISYEELFGAIYDYGYFSEEAFDYIRKLHDIMGNDKFEISDVLKLIGDEIYNVKLSQKPVAESKQNENIPEESETFEVRAEESETFGVKTEESENTNEPAQDEEKIKNDEFIKNLNRQYEILTNGPKNKTIFSRTDTNYMYINKLYALAADIILLLNSESPISVTDDKYDSSSLYSSNFPAVDGRKEEQIYERYKVSNLNELLDKYEQIREKYYKYYMKLSDKEKQRYKYKTSVAFTSNLTSFSSNLSEAMQNDFDFPPSKSEIISLINTRIIQNGKFSTVLIKDGEKITDVFLTKDYREAKEYYTNLSKRMSEKEIVELYKSVVGQFYANSSKVFNGDMKDYYIRNVDVIQRVFCEILIDKKNIKCENSEQYDAEILRVAKEVLKEEVRFPLSVSKEDSSEMESGYLDEKQQRTKTMMEEYLIFFERERALGKDKNQIKSFLQYVQERYGYSQDEFDMSVVEEQAKKM